MPAPQHSSSSSFSPSPRSPPLSVLGISLPSPQAGLIYDFKNVVKNLELFCPEKVANVGCLIFVCVSPLAAPLLSHRGFWNFSLCVGKVYTMHVCCFLVKCSMKRKLESSFICVCAHTLREQRDKCAG